MIEESIYLEHGATLFQLAAGKVDRNIRRIEEAFSVSLLIRDNWIKVQGEEAGVKATQEMFRELLNFFCRRNGALNEADFEQVFKACSSGSGRELAGLMAAGLNYSNGRKTVYPRSRAQFDYLKAMRRCDVTFGIGPAGTGKTYLAMAMAVSELLAGNCQRIVLTRPAREAGEELGFLPGSLEDKIMPYLRPLYDALYDLLDHSEVQKLLACGAVEVAPLAFMRGRTLNGSFIILDEAQNTTKDQMLMFLTRMGFGSRCVVTGDPTQNDLMATERSGLEHACRTLNDIPEIAFCHFTSKDVVRHALLEKIINAYAAQE